ncbi:MAG: nucleotidyl transferase AbiEii/AbiGii toxin family protein [Treponema sp.]|jgi:predicted nucleotidyltransferase component of viral defense system|nr:nucleotidyl transferase AbiEii/AbiGii toxin family protein [Treponema sp.]
MNKNIDIIANRLAVYNPDTNEIRFQAIQEITQEIILASLAETSFFNNAIFIGGTALRILYGLDRYSEDLDFHVVKKDTGFQWKSYLAMVKEKTIPYGYYLKTEDKSKPADIEKRAYITDKSICQKLKVNGPDENATTEVSIKLEYNSDPPTGCKIITRTLNYPISCVIKTMDLPSLFAGKCHALLCRNREKGRDWYDFLWLNTKNIEPNYNYLSSALNRRGPWEGRGIKADRNWLEKAVSAKINTLNIDAIKRDVIGFVSNLQKENVARWNKDILLSSVDTFHKNCLKRDKEKSRDDDFGR